MSLPRQALEPERYADPRSDEENKFGKGHVNGCSTWLGRRRVGG